MKKLKTIVVSLLIFTAITDIQAQWNIGTQVNYLKFIAGNSRTGHLGSGVSVFHSGNEHSAWGGWFNYYLPVKYEPEERVYESDIPYTLGLYQVSVGWRSYFVGDNKDDFNIYWSAYAGYLIGTLEYNMADVDKNLTELSKDYTEQETLHTLNVIGGLGAEYKTGPLYLFSEVLLNFPSNKATGTYVHMEMSISTNVNIGARIPFGK